MSWRDRRGPNLIALGFFLARRGVMTAISYALTVAFVAGSGAIAVFLARRHRPEALASVPLTASSALAFGVGVLAAFAVSTRAFQRDEDDGVRALLTARGVRVTGYFTARIIGLATLLAILVAGGSALVGFVTLLACRSRAAAIDTLQASFASVVFGAAFALVFACIAMAALGGRSRGHGYLVLLLVLVLPDLVQPWLVRFVPAAWLDLLSLPRALVGLRTSLAAGSIDFGTMGRSLVILFAVVVGSLAIVRAELTRAHGSSPRGRFERTST